MTPFFPLGTTCIPVVAIGITAGVLAGLWTQFSTPFGLISWAGSLSEACFFAAGGTRTGLLKTIPAHLSGVLWGGTIAWGPATLPIPGTLGISVVLAVFGMRVHTRWSLLSFIPGAFVGCAAYFGTTFDLVGTCLALIAGACLGGLSEYTAGILANAGRKTPEPAPHADTQPLDEAAAWPFLRPHVDSSNCRH